VSAPAESPGSRAALWRTAQLAAVSGLALARLLVLARLLAPDDFGLYAIAVTVLGLVTSLTDPGIIPALALRPDPTFRQLDAGWTAGVVRGALVAAALAVWADPLAALFHEPRAAPLLRVLALVPLIVSFSSIGTAALIRRFQFRSLALVQVADAAANTAAAITLAPAVGVWAFPAGALAGSLAAVMASYAVAPANPHFVYDRAASRSLVAFGGWLLATGAVAAATDFALRAAIARRLGAGPLGVFSLAMGLALLPVSAASELLRLVSLPLYARLAGNTTALRRAFRTLAAGLAMTLVPAYAVLAASAEGIGKHLLDPRWAGVAPVIQVFAIACALGIVAEAAVPLFQGVRLARLAVGLELAQLVVVILTIRWLMRNLGFTGPAIAWLAGVIVALFLTRFLLYRILGRSPDQRHRIGTIVGAGAMAALVTLAVPLFRGGRLGLLLSVVAGLATAAVVMWRLDRHWRLGMFEDLKQLADGSRL
jgi:O-antigen/teichoic acid export membrane protein